MAGVALDTHALVWYVEGSPLLSGPALGALQTAVGLDEPIFVSSICLVEIAYLVDKGKLPAPLLDRILQIVRPRPNRVDASSVHLRHG